MPAKYELDDKAKRRNKIGLLIAILVFAASVGLLATRIVRQRAWREQQARQAQVSRGSGTDIRRQMRSMDEMNDVFIKRYLQENAECHRLHLPYPETHKRTNAVYQAGVAEIKRVTDSNYTLPFDASVMDKASKDASSRE